MTVITGEPGMVDQMLVTSGLELATNPWAGSFDLLMAGFPEKARLASRTHGCASLDEGIGLLESRRAHLGPACGGTDRLGEPAQGPASPGWDLTLLVARDPPSPQQMTRILAHGREHTAD